MADVESWDEKYSDNDILKMIDEHKDADVICEAAGFDIRYLRYRVQQISRKQQKFVTVENLYKKGFAPSVSPFVDPNMWHVLNEARFWEQVEREGHQKRVLGEKLEK
ncbi:MAG: hypothetical protein PHP23_12280 [Desulfobacterales bacterium]|nr:hypothetical protein [Desulfobacterales bacterium]MDD4073834.1 hypothetical protein [Desulfobacterales bacterium]MDD4393744.1 hypothetical protein [Desulfobacterales bacterium]